MLTHDGTSITEAVMLAASDELGISKQDIDYDEIQYAQYTPESLDRPSEDRAGKFDFYRLSVYVGDDVATGYAIRNTQKTYGRPISVELHDDSLNA